MRTYHKKGGKKGRGRHFSAGSRAALTTLRHCPLDLDRDGPTRFRANLQCDMPFLDRRMNECKDGYWWLTAGSDIVQRG